MHKTLSQQRNSYSSLDVIGKKTIGAHLFTISFVFSINSAPLNTNLKIPQDSPLVISSLSV